MTDCLIQLQSEDPWMSERPIVRQSHELVRLFLSLPNSEARRLVLARLTEYAASQSMQQQPG